MPETLQAHGQALFVAWQHPATRVYFPVGRLVAHPAPGLPKYEFAYLRGAQTAANEGVEKLLAFPKLDRVYRSDDLFPFFTNRLMPPSRPDYQDYVANLGLDPSNNDPMEVLIRSGGARATDSLEMFALPTYDLDGNPFKTHFLAHGLRYLHPASLDRLDNLKPDEKLRIIHDCQNEADLGALALRTEDRLIVGYIPRYLLGDAFTLLQTCATTEVFVARVNRAPVPLQQRLLCRLEACWPGEFRPYCDDAYQPISQQAVNVSCGR